MIFENTFPREKEVEEKIWDGYVIETVSLRRGKPQKFKWTRRSYPTMKEALEEARVLQEHFTVRAWHIYDEYDHVVRGWRRDPCDHRFG